MRKIIFQRVLQIPKFFNHSLLKIMCYLYRSENNKNINIIIIKLNLYIDDLNNMEPMKIKKAFIDNIW